MRVVSIEIENILSIEKMSLSFPKQGLILVDGWNHDTNSANGAGKSSIFHALSWCLFGEYPRGVSITDFIRHGSKFSNVRLVVDLPNIGILNIERKRPKAFLASLNGKDVSEEEVKHLIPIDYDQYLIAQYFAQGLGNRFLDLADSARKDVILKIMKAEAFANYRRKIENDLTSLVSEKNNTLLSINSLEAKIAAFSESIVDCSQMELRLSQLNESYEKYINEIKYLNIEKPSEIDKYSQLIDKLTLKLNSLSVIKGSVISNRKLLKDLETLPEPEDVYDGVCPCCNTQLDFVNNELVRHNSYSFIKKKESHKQSIEHKKISLIDAIKQMELELLKEEDIMASINKLKNKIKDARAEYDLNNQRLQDLNLFIAKLQSEQKTIVDNLEKQRNLLAKIQQAKSTITDLSEKLNSIKDREQILETSSHIMSPLGVPAYVMDSVISALNDKVQDLLQYIWPNSSYQLLSFRENKSGTVTPKMSDLLVINGNKCPIGSLSGGERRCLSLALDFALADVVSLYTGAQLNPLILDEPFDHLDASNRSKVIDFLQQMAERRCIVVIDHASEAKSLFDKIITVYKKNGISMVQENGITY